MSDSTPKDLVDVFDKINNDFLIDEEESETLFHKTTSGKCQLSDANAGKYYAINTDTEETRVLERHVLDLSYMLNDLRRRCAETDKRLSAAEQQVKALSEERWALLDAQGKVLERLNNAKKTLADKKLFLLTISRYNRL